jgi:ribonuclease BN (tRNA processing enzyme)
MVEISMLGSGAGMNGDLGNTSLLVYENVGPKLLVDCGSSVPVALAGRDSLTKKNMFDEIQHIALTHTHSDHSGGLEILGFARMYGPGEKPILYVATDKMRHNLWEHTLRGGMAIPRNGEFKYGFNGHEADIDRPMVLMGNDGLEVHGRNIASGDHFFQDRFGQGGQELTLDDYFDVRVGMMHNVNGKSFSFLPTPHTPLIENYGVRFKTEDANVYYSADTLSLPGPGLEGDAFIQDIQFPDFDVGFNDGVFNNDSNNNAHATWRQATSEWYLNKVSEEQRAKTFFTHLWAGHKDHNPTDFGYGGFLLPGTHISVEGHMVNYRP